MNSYTPKPLPVGAPIVDQNRPFHIWNSTELYNPETRQGNWVPNVNDLIVDYVRNVFNKVIRVNYTSYVYETLIWTPISELNSDIDVGGAAPHTSDSFRVFIDPSKFPQTLRVDSRLTFKGSDNDHVKIFRGTDISDNGEVISAYIRNGALAGENIPLELVAIDNVTNHSIKVPVAGACKKQIENGELVTIVVYADQDRVTAIARCYVVLTNLVLSNDTPARVIRDVKLKSPFISPADDHLLELPVNIPIEDIPLYYEVTYTDGVVTNNIDGTRASLLGLRNSGSHDNFYISTITGQELDLVLSYRMNSNETYIGDDVFNNTICRDYKATTLAVDGAYSVKLFVVPQWLDEARGYRLNYYLYNLERGNVFDATAHVTLGVNTPAFDPTLYGVKQHLAISCNLNKVSPVYNSHVHVQSFAITLLAQGNMHQDPYLIEYTQGKDAYGQGLHAKYNYDNVKYWRIDLSCGITDKTQWLKRLYRDVYPLFDRRTESEAPDPTHFEVIIGNKQYTRAINDWVNSFNIDFEVRDGQYIYIKWICRTPHDELQLGASPLLLQQVN